MERPRIGYLQNYRTNGISIQEQNAYRSPREYQRRQQEAKNQTIIIDQTVTGRDGATSVAHVGKLGA